MILGDLVSTSLLPHPTRTGRYLMLEPVRQYAWSLAEAKGEITELANRHADWYVQFAHYCELHHRTAAQITVCGVCTICDGRFHSHRAEPNAGRNLALLAR